jgi:hypothetical protein
LTYLHFGFDFDGECYAVALRVYAIERAGLYLVTWSQLA